MEEKNLDNMSVREMLDLAKEIETMAAAKAHAQWIALRPALAKMLTTPHTLAELEAALKTDRIAIVWGVRDDRAFKRTGDLIEYVGEKSPR